MKKILKNVLIILILFIIFGVKSVKALDTIEGLTKILTLGDYSVNQLVSMGDIDYFEKYTAETGYELWRTDRTEIGTYMIKDINPGSDGSAIDKLVVIGENLYFYAYTNDYGYELWKSNGTTSGTIMVKDINIGSGDSKSVDDIVELNGIVYFFANDGSGAELWKTNGTESGTSIVKDINSTDIFTTGLKNFYLLNNELYFFIRVEDNSIQLWKTDGTSGGTTSVSTLSGMPLEFGDNGSYIVYNNNLYFLINDGSWGTDLWQTDGTAEGTKVVQYDIDNGLRAHNNSVVYNNKLYFTAYDNTNWFELYSLDTSGTVIRITGDTFNSIEEVLNLTVYNDILYFSDSYGKLWQTDGTDENTEITKAFIDDLGDCGLYLFKTYNGKLYFQRVTYGENDNGDFYAELWESDGTTLGTTMISAYLAYGEGAFPYYLTDNGIYYTYATDYFDSEGYKFWASNLELWNYKSVSPIIYFNVTFKDYNDAVLKTESVMEGGNATAPSNPTRIGYTFTGWDKTFSNITNILTVTATYSINTYTVNFKDYDNSILKTQTINYGNAATAPNNPTRTGYTFTGWDKTYNNITNNLIVNALYDINTYTVNFKNYDGTALKTEIVNYGSNATAPSNPTRTGYTFTGWDKTFNVITNNLDVTPIYSKNVVEEPIAEPVLEIENITTDVSDIEKENYNFIIQDNIENKELIDLYDINLILNGENVQPNGSIEIRILMTEEQKQYENIQVIFIGTNNEIEVIPHTIDGEYIVFSVNHLSKYAIIGDKEEVKNIEDVSIEEDNNNNVYLIGGISILVIIIFLIVLYKRRNKSY